MKRVVSLLLVVFFLVAAVSVSLAAETKQKGNVPGPNPDSGDCTPDHHGEE